MLDDVWEQDYMEFVEQNPLTLCSGLAYRGMANKLKNAQRMNALIFDLMVWVWENCGISFSGLAEDRSVFGGCLCRLSLFCPETGASVLCVRGADRSVSEY